MTSGSEDILQPDARVVLAIKTLNSSNAYSTHEFGHINIQIMSDGSAIHKYNPIHARVSDEEVFLNIRLSSADAMTLYAVRRFKIESYENDVTTRLTPMQPNVQRGEPIVDGFFVNKSKPADFSCMELDLSAMPVGRIVTFVTCCMLLIDMQERVLC